MLNRILRTCFERLIDMQTPDKTIDHSTLRRLVDAGANVGAEVVGASGGWGVVINYGRASQTLAATELGGILDEAFDIAVRPGLHCAPYIHRAIGTFPDGTVRVSPGPFNTVEDIDKLAGALREILS